MKIQRVLITILVVGNIVGWSLVNGLKESASLAQQEITDLNFKVKQLQTENDNQSYDIATLQDDLKASGYRAVDLTKVAGKTSNSHTLGDILKDSSLWNKRQDIDKFLGTLLSGNGSFGSYDMAARFASFSRYKWDAIELTKTYWEELNSNGVISVIVVGNLDLHGEAFSESNSAWLLVLYMDYGKNGWSKTEPLHALIFEPTRRYSVVIHVHDYISTQYMEGYFYIMPSELEADTVSR